MIIDGNVAPAASNTIAEYKEIYSEINKNIDRIKKLAKRYPVYLILAEDAYRFDDVAVIDLFIANLNKAIKDYGKLG